MSERTETIKGLLPAKQAKERRFFNAGKHYQTVLLGSIIPLIMIVAWELASRAGLVEPHILPSPLTIIEEITEMAAEGTLWSHIGITASRIFSGFLIGTLAALVLGSLVGWFSLADKLMDPLIQAFRSIPGLAWVPLFILWLGIGESSKVLLIAVGVFFPVYLNIVSGIQGVDRKLIEVGRIYHFTPAQTLRKIILPASLPSFIVGIRSGLGLGWMFVVAAELMGASSGIGYLLVVGQNTYSPELVIASIVLFAVLGKTTDALLKIVERKSLSWQDNLTNKS